MCFGLKLTGASGIFGRIWLDRAGAVPREIIALTSAVLLLGLAVMETHGTDTARAITKTNEEIFVRKCSQPDTIIDQPALSQINGPLTCR